MCSCDNCEYPWPTDSDDASDSGISSSSGMRDYGHSTHLNPGVHMVENSLHPSERAGPRITRITAGIAIDENGDAWWPALNDGSGTPVPRNHWGVPEDTRFGPATEIFHAMSNYSSYGRGNGEPTPTEQEREEFELSKLFARLGERFGERDGSGRPGEDGESHGEWRELMGARLQAPRDTF